MSALHGSATRRPVLILAMPRSFSSIVSTMLGQHPGLYGFPELHLFAAETMSEWLHQAARTSFSMEHGLLRTVAQLQWGEQTEQTIRRARAWILKRRDFTTGMMFDALLELIYPRQGVEKGPTVIFRAEYMQRALRLYPDARFVHLVRSPLTYGESVLRLLREEVARGESSRWLVDLLYYPDLKADLERLDDTSPLSAQRGWLEMNQKAQAFLATLPAHQYRTVRGEELLADPRHTLHTLVEWLELDASDAAIREMMHPERSPYARFGPEGARNGGDPHFLARPEFRPASAAPRSTRAEPSLHPEVAELARLLGYEAPDRAHEKRGIA